MAVGFKSIASLYFPAASAYLKTFKRLFPSSFSAFALATTSSVGPRLFVASLSCSDIVLRKSFVQQLPALLLMFNFGYSRWRRVLSLQPYNAKCR